MSESFWYMDGDDGPERAADEPSGADLFSLSEADFSPFHEPMRGERRHMRAPSTDQKRMRRQIHRSGQWRTAGHDEVDWDVEYPRIHQHAENGELHRGLGLDLPDELHQYVHDESQPVHERARALLEHIAGEDSREYAGDTGRLGLGMHWSMHRNQAHQFAHENGPEYAARNFEQHTADDDNLHDFTYGSRPGDVDADQLAEHLHTHHGVSWEEQDRAAPWAEQRHHDLAYLHRNVHRKPMPGQTDLFPLARGDRKPDVQDRHIDLNEEMRGPEVGRARPATEIILSTPVPPRHLIEDDPDTNPNMGGEVYHPFRGGEYEVPLRQGAKIPITQVSWTKVHFGPDANASKGSTWTHHRFDAPEQHEAMTRRTAMGPAFDEVNWDELHPQLKDMADDQELHRGIGINLPDELHRYIHDSSQPRHERAHALLNHIAGMNGREPGDHRLGLGMHWSLSNGVAEGFAAEQADHYADANKDKANGDGEDTAHDFSWGKVPGDVDMSQVKEHLHEHHGIHPFQQPVSYKGVEELHTMLHRGAPPIPGQQALFPEPPKVPKANQHVGLDEFREAAEPRGKPGTEIVLHTPIPAREDIEEHPQGNPNAGGDVYHPLNHGEAEVPIRAGASLPITGVSWREHPHWADTIGEKDPEYVHHRFDDKDMPSHEARRTAAYETDRMPPHERVTDWDDVVGDHDTSDWRIHRGVKLWPKGNLWDRVNDKSRPVHERARELVDHITSERGNLGMHWSSDEDFAKRVAKDGGWSAIGNNGSPKDMEYALSMPVVVHARWPHKEHFETDPNELHANHVLPYGYGENLADEWETPLKKGAPVHITGISWAAYDNPREHEWAHHTFDEPIRHTATVLNTQIERLSQGDQVRTPTGQTVTVQKVRPHETDATKVYLDTDMGTSVVDRGTDFQVVPHNSQQQELPDTGNPMGSGNSGQLPAAGKTPGGAGSTPATAPGSCPNCGNSGTLHLHGANYICSVCGFTVPAGGSPGGLLFTNQPSGYLPGRRQPGPAPRAHVWASKYTTTTQESQIARRARQVLSGGDQ